VRRFPAQLFATAAQTWLSPPAQRAALCSKPQKILSSSTLCDSSTNMAFSSRAASSPRLQASKDLIKLSSLQQQHKHGFLLPRSEQPYALSLKRSYQAQLFATASRTWLSPPAQRAALGFKPQKILSSSACSQQQHKCGFLPLCSEQP
jgi:hypothetical protein